MHESSYDLIFCNKMNIYYDKHIHGNKLDKNAHTDQNLFS